MAVVKLNITLRQLRAFIVVYECGSFSAAAEVLSITQGALSHLLNELERQLGFRVLERTTRKLGLTQEGRKYLKQARKVLAEVHKLNQLAEELLQGSRSRFVLGSTAALIASALPVQLQRYSETWPDFQIELKDYQPDELVDAVAEGKVDLGIGPIRQDLTSSVRVEKLFSSPLMVVTARDHPLARRPAVSWKELRDQTLVLQSQRALRHLERESGFDFADTQIIELSQLHSILSIVESGDGVTLVAEYARKYLTVHNVVALPVTEPKVLMDVGLYSKKNNDVPDAARIFRAFIQEQYSRENAT